MSNCVIKWIVVVCALAPQVAAQPVDDARTAADEAKKSADDSKTSAVDAKASAESASKNAKAANEARAKTEKALEDAGTSAVDAPAAEETASVFDKLQFLGNANLIAGSLTTEGGETLASGGIGVYAQTKKWSLVTAFTFGSEGTTDENADIDDYISFLRTPTSAVGGQVQVRFLHSIGKAQVVRIGGSINTRVNVQKFAFGEGMQEAIKLLAIDPALAVSVLFSEKQEITFIGEIGLGLRFWNKPAQSFRDAIGIPDDSHTYAGARVLAAIAVSNVYVGIEVSRYGGGQLSEFEEFAIIPYVGVRGGLEVFDKQKEAAPAKGGADKAPPPSTPLM